jgi:hypothetical protein
MGVTLNEYIEKAMHGVEIEEAMPARDPGSEYKLRMNQIKKSMKALQDKLKGHEKKQMKDPGNWGYLGDLENINKSLYELLDALRNV